MAYKLPISPRSSNAGRFIISMHDDLRAAVIESGKTYQQIAEALETDTDYVDAVMEGRRDLTLRVIADFMWAIEYKMDYTIRKKDTR